MPIGITTRERIASPVAMLAGIRSLISKLSESKLGVDKIFGFDSQHTERHEGEDCLPIARVKERLQNYLIPTQDYILQAFKLNQDKELISLRRLTEAIENWKQNIYVLDELNDEEEDEEDEDSYDGFDQADEQA